jgi:hypothetical protein
MPLVLTGGCLGPLRSGLGLLGHVLSKVLGCCAAISADNCLEELPATIEK